MRSQHEADIVIVFTGEPTGACGAAFQRNWIRKSQGEPPPDFDPQPPHMLDLRDRDQSFVAIVGTEGACQTSDDLHAAHEFGHLFGGGHADVFPLPDPYFDPWLYPDSRAHVDLQTTYIQEISWSLTEGFKTVLAGPNPNDCQTLTTLGFCQWLGRFSKNGTQNGDDSAENERALATTALSVANYFTKQCEDAIDNDANGPDWPADADCTSVFDNDEFPPPVTQCSDGVDNDGDSLVDYPDDPGCVSASDDDESNSGGGGGCDATVSVTNVTATLENLCIFYPFSEYTISWDHACPGEVTHYELYYAQPPSAPPTFGWDIYSPSQSTLLWVSGVDSNVRIIACD